MNPIAHLVMLGCIPAIMYVFSRMPAQRAVIICFIACWMFLPWAGYKIQGLPEYSRTTATCYGILIAALIFDSNRLRTFRPALIDLPIAIFCLVPFVSSMVNGLGPYDGFSAALSQTVVWAFPYFLGRLYLNDLAGLQKLAVAIFAGGIIYIPFCLIETRMSQIFHLKLYGFYSYTGGDSRLGGWRPSVFMQNGLMLGVWMMLATLVGIWLWRTKVIKKLFGVDITKLLIALIFTFILARALGAYTLLILGLIVLFSARHFKTILPLLLIVIAMTSYVFISASGNFTDQQRKDVVSVVSLFSPPDRVQSFDFRLQNEKILSNKARQQPLFGWGGWGRSRVYDVYGKDITITDSLWIITYGANGYLGLVSLFSIMLTPVVMFCRRYPASTWSHPKVAPAAALAVGLMLYTLDCIINAMINPLFILICGGVSGLVLKQPESLRVLALPAKHAGRVSGSQAGPPASRPLPNPGVRLRRPSPRRFL